MIEYVKGNLLDFPAGCTAIAHCCNAQGVMGSGIAKSIKEEYPEAFRVYREAFESTEESGFGLGHVSSAKTVSGKVILNCVAQEFYGTDKKRYVDYEAFYSCFEAIKEKLELAYEQGKKPVLGIPYRIASDRAGGSWLVIEAMLKTLFEGSQVKLVIVEYNQ